MLEGAMHIPAMKRVPIDAARAYIRGLQAKTGLTPTELARRAGLSQTTLTRPLQDNYKGEMKLETLRRLADRFDAPLPKEIDPEANHKRQDRALTAALILARKFGEGRTLNVEQEAELVREIRETLLAIYRQ